MKQIIRNQSIVIVLGFALLSIVLNVTCLPQKVSSENDTYVLGRARISYTVPITPAPTCTTQNQMGRFIYTKSC